MVPGSCLETMQNGLIEARVGTGAFQLARLLPRKHALSRRGTSGLGTERGHAEATVGWSRGRRTCTRGRRVLIEGAGPGWKGKREARGLKRAASPRLQLGRLLQGAGIGIECVEAEPSDNSSNPTILQCMSSVMLRGDGFMGN